MNEATEKRKRKGKLRTLDARITVTCFKEEKEAFEDVMDMIGNRSSPYLRKLMRETIAAYKGKDESNNIGR